MKPPVLYFTIIGIWMISSLFANAGEVYNVPDSAVVSAKEKRVYNTTRLTSDPPKIDGKLQDECWLKESSWSGNYRQFIPKEGAAPTQPTEIKVLYDNENIYVAIRAYDDPEKIDSYLGRRDEFSGDIVGICFDSYHDYRTGFEFDLTAAGSKIDLVLLNDRWDTNWDAVWNGKTGREDSAWTAEMQIPLSQLRYGNQKEQVWGMHAWRWINRNQEEDQWNLMPRDNPGFLYSIGEIHGINDLPRSRRIELMPYTVAKMHTFEREQGNPFADGSDNSLSAGLDGKIGLSSDMTLDFTVNPDFGQIEADPAVLNLSAYEIFFEEKRPFFLEGKNISDFDFDDDLLFYSRRIGKQPVYKPEVEENEFVQSPDNTSILGAVKVSGKNKKGLSLSILESLTAQEFAQISNGEDNQKMVVEPMTNYLVTRVQQDIKNSNTIIGGIVTSTNRFSQSAHLNDFSRDALTGGIDVKHFWKDKTYYIEAKTIFSHIAGRQEAIYQLQRSSARYYQRPDAGHLHLDSTRTALSGFGGKIKVGKGSNGKWRFSESVTMKSPGLELNDLGYLRNTDLIEQSNEVAYIENEPGKWYRQYDFHFALTNRWNYGGTYLNSYGYFLSNLQFKNKWRISGRVLRYGKAYETTLLRGGPGVNVKGFWCNNYSIHTDHSKKFSGSFRTHFHVFDDKKSSIVDFHPGIQYRITNGIRISTQMDYGLNKDIFQYVTTENVNNQDEYVLAQLDQETLGMTFRMDLAITPELTVQYYGNPYFTTGKYSNFKLITNPSARSYNDLYEILELPLNDDNKYVFDQNSGTTFHNPDFNFGQFRSNLVARWEYRPGSTIYLVWSHSRSDRQDYTIHSLHDGVDHLFGIYPDNIFLVKVNYWLSL